MGISHCKCPLLYVYFDVYISQPFTLCSWKCVFCDESEFGTPHLNLLISIFYQMVLKLSGLVNLTSFHRDLCAWTLYRKHMIVGRVKALTHRTRCEFATISPRIRIALG